MASLPLSIVVLFIVFLEVQSRSFLNSELPPYPRGQSLIPRSSLMISGRGYMPGFVDSSPSMTFALRKRSDVSPGDWKRAGRTANVPRSGLMIAGRGWMPGFADTGSRTYLVKRSAIIEPEYEDILI